MKTVEPQGSGGSNPPCSERSEEQGRFETKPPPSECEEERTRMSAKGGEDGGEMSKQDVCEWNPESPAEQVN